MFEHLWQPAPTSRWYRFHSSAGSDARSFSVESIARQAGSATASRGLARFAASLPYYGGGPGGDCCLAFEVGSQRSGLALTSRVSAAKLSCGKPASSSLSTPFASGSDQRAELETGDPGVPQFRCGARPCKRLGHRSTLSGAWSAAVL